MTFEYEGKTFQVRYHHARPPAQKGPKLPKDMDIRITVGGQVLVIPIGAAFKQDGYLIGHTGVRAAGVTTATLGLLVNQLIVQEPGMLTKPPVKFVPLAWGQASCAIGDQFSKKFGRLLAFERLVTAVFLKDPKLADVLVRAIPDPPKLDEITEKMNVSFRGIQLEVDKPSPFRSSYKNGTGGPYIPRRKA